MNRLRAPVWAALGWALSSALLLPWNSAAQSPAASSPLTRPVRPVLSNAPLAQLLADVSRQSGVPVSYSSTRIDARRRCRLRPGPARSLGALLHEIAAQHQLSYGLLNGQLVLWPAAATAPPGVVELNGLGQAAASGIATAAGSGRPVASGSPRTAGNSTNLASVGKLPLPLSVRPGTTSKASTGLAAPATGAAAVGAQAATARAAAVAGNAASAAAAPAASVRTSKQWAIAEAKRRAVQAQLSVSKARSAALARYQQAKAVAAPEAQAAAVTTDSPTQRLLSAASAANPSSMALAALLPRRVALQEVAGASEVPRPLAGPLAAGPLPTAPSQPVLRRRVGQVSVLPPLSSNWLANSRSVNDYSLNVLAGYSAGVKKVEIGGLLNVVRDTVRGFQAAGLANLTGTDVRGVQLAGLANVNGGAARGVQGAGLVNIARDDARGLQVAGLANLTGGAARASRHPDQPTRLRRWLGLPRLLATDPLGRLPAAPSSSQPGFLVQAAAITNITGTDVRGVQTAAVLNLGRRITGAQLGLVNVARHVRGVQVGLVNIADSVDGAGIGLINIVRHGGYLHGEVWASETLPLNAVLKLGVRRYYTILGAAAEPFGSRVQWAGGIGIGTAGRPKGRFTLSLDAVQWTLAGTTDDPAAEVIDARLLTQLRPAVAWQIEKNGRLQLVLAPTLNLAIAWSNDHQPQWDFGANQFLLIDTAGAQSRTRLWLGAQVGLRF